MATLHSRTVGAVEVVTIVAGRWSTNCHVLRAGEVSMIVDPGAEPEAIIEAVGRTRVVDVLLTHGHYDHLGAAKALSEHYGVACRAHRADLDLLRLAPAYAMAFDRSVLSLPEVEPLDPDSLILGELRVQVIPCPGHTKGSVAFQLPGLVLTGDTLLHRAVGRTDLPGGDLDLLSKSVTDLLGSSEPSALLLAGHGRPWVVAEARSWWSAQVASASKP